MNNSQYSDQKLGCEGHACATCGNCRDWYWRPSGNIDNPKIYTKRNDASCIRDRADFYGRHRFDYPIDNYRYYYHSSYGYGLCECDNNSS